MIIETREIKQIMEKANGSHTNLSTSISKTDAQYLAAVADKMGFTDHALRRFILLTWISQHKEGKHRDIPSVSKKEPKMPE